jgi:DnaJ-class molecular chaperone
MEERTHEPFEPEIKRKPLRVCSKCLGQGCLFTVDEHDKPHELWCEECNGSGWIDDT